MRVVCLISGRGSNLQSIIDAGQSHNLGSAQIVGVISNKPDAYGLMRAVNACIPTRTLQHYNYASRGAFDCALATLIDSFYPDLVVLAGFMRILTDRFVNHYHGRLINIHPSLLPKYKGLNTHQRAIDAGDCETGASVHWVTSELDAGEIIEQISVPILLSDTVESLKARVLNAEHRLYPAVIRNLAKDSKVL